MPSRIAALYETGLSERDIASKLGCSRGFVRRRLIAECIPSRPVTCGNEPRVEIVCEMCLEPAMRRAYLARRAKYQLCGRPACHTIFRMVYGPIFFKGLRTDKMRGSSV
jgi:hypothetical protein